MASIPDETTREPPAPRAVPRPEGTRVKGQKQYVNRLVRNDGGVDADVLGITRRPVSDAYFNMLAAPWSHLLGFIAATYFGINAVFASVYAIAGGVEGARPGSFADAFFFSVQTMATIGYGTMSPKSTLANVLVTMEALIGMLSVAMATGVLFAKFARPTGQLVFSDLAVVNFREGVPSLLFLVANERINHVAEATLKVALVITEITQEGERMRRWYDLDLVRRESPLFALTWTAIHEITAKSRLHGKTPAALKEMGAEIIVTLVGLDATLAATIHKRHSYMVDEIVWGGRMTDILRAGENGRRIVDLTKFHDVTHHADEEQRVLAATGAGAAA